MIKRIWSEAELNPFCDYIADYIKCNIKAYGFSYDFLKVYIQYSAEGEALALIGDFCGKVSVSILSLSEVKELKAFAEMLCEVELLIPYKALSVFESENAKLFYAVACKTEKKSENSEPSKLDFLEAQRLYDLFSQGDEDVKVGRFDDWYADVNHRLRHAAADAVIFKEGGALLLKNGDSGIICGIAIDRNKRGLGYGKRIIRSAKLLNIGKISALCSEKNLPFYKKCGFIYENKYILLKKE